MLPDGSIRVHELWKRFRADRQQRSFRDQFANLGRHRSDAERWRWVLKDIELAFEPGDAVGLIGANGSGKSTLLKILTGVMYPYAGSLDVAGRVGALLEVRSGLHGDLSGRENVFLYGGLLGLSRAEVARRFDDIVDFSVLADAIDRQVKFYSSGMQMRLGFSVAAFLEPNVLLVDEALAVGDAFFQQRCLDRMRDLLHQGTTLVLVSHDLAAIESVCTRGVWLKDGEVESDAEVRTALGHYRTWLDDAYHAWIDETSDEAVYRPGVIEVSKSEVGRVGGGFPRSQEAMVIDLVLESPSTIEGSLCLGITEGTASPIFLVSEDVTLSPGRNTVQCTIPHVPLAAGRYYLWLEFDGSRDDELHIPWQPTTAFGVEGRELTRSPIGVMRVAAVQVDAEWSVGEPPGPDTFVPDPS